MFNDEFRGLGGSYILDPKTGKRRRASDDQDRKEPEREQEKTQNTLPAGTVKKSKGDVKQ